MAYVWFIGIDRLSSDHGPMSLPQTSEGFSPRLRRRSAAPRRKESAIYVASDWPDDLPVRKAEVGAVEAWLGEILDDIWGPIP